MVTNPPGRFPVIPRCSLCALLLPALLGLAGCGSLLTATTADVAGVAGAGAANAVTKDAAVATGIGLGVAAGANAGLHYVERDVHAAEQNQIAAAAGPLSDGAVARWHVTHRIPIEPDEQGEVAVTRTIGGTGFTCKEIVFSIDHGSGARLRRAFYLATICRDGAVWRWALAEPATARWGSLQ